MPDLFMECGATSAKDLIAAQQADGLPRTDPSMAGVDADAIVAFLNDVEAAGLDLHAFMLHRNGRVVAEGWRWPYRPDRPRNLHSVVKSFTACAIGLALEEGLFKLDDKVVSFFPELIVEPDQGWLTEMSIEDLLTMRVGHASETSGAEWRSLNTSWIAEFFKIRLAQEPGTAFMYTSAASYMLSAILSRATGVTLHEYLKPRIFEPMGIEGESWDIGPDGINPGGNGLIARTADLLKLGVLHAQNGIWEGKRLLPESWVAAATTAHGEPAKYGYHWWTRPDGTYSAIGKFVQMTTVFPLHGATLAVTGAIKGSAKLFPYIDRYFPAAFRDQIRDDIEDGAAADARLKARLAEWQSPDAPAPWKEPYERAGALTDGARAPGQTERFLMHPNAQGVSELQFEFVDETCVFRLIDAHGEHVIAAGFGRWLESRANMPGSDLHHGYQLDNSPVVARACWLDNTRLQMTWIFAETAFRDTVICEFSGKTITFKREVNINGGELRHEDITGSLADSLAS
ncbi:Beta-lactamase (plasmid) [Caballeronia sp. SBC1]|uniref:serine hydrolase domain-containing protein n=1 Tax=unclassified Caballeronia TaxID=2646786 RepID=UPI0013E12AF3|nr:MULTISPECIES: serine hydrolase [unclassified Caballeronia]QIE28864.1 Beta-lactamase [Caballeronia sp. SBC2]QIN66919.1 Beta-lactamase [Caballeronia sp. SBC1]